jgi:hypothetical protein
MGLLAENLLAGCGKNSNLFTVAAVHEGVNESESSAL